MDSGRQLAACGGAAAGPLPRRATDSASRSGWDNDPPAGEYETEAEAVRAMRKQAAKRGADAIYIESQSESGGWKFGTMGGLSGGSFSELRFRAEGDCVEVSHTRHLLN
jgi:hypothetical protein